MRLLYNKIFLEHDTGQHPENSHRLDYYKKLADDRATENINHLTLFHTPQYIESIKKACSSIQSPTPLDADTIISPRSFETAAHAVETTIEASNHGDLALVRPPGHHAHPSHASGFCIFNNISIAALYQNKKGKRVLIFDFDGHLGDGTEKFFLPSSEVMYFSLHQYPAFPGGGGVNDIGTGKGKGYTINIPLSPGTGDDIVNMAIERFLPIAIQFKPDIVAVSAGFDSHHSDPLLELRYSSVIYYFFGTILRKNFKNIFATLEGGYNEKILPSLIGNFISGINGTKIQHTEEETTSSFLLLEEFEETSKRLQENLSPYWQV